MIEIAIGEATGNVVDRGLHIIVSVATTTSKTLIPPVANTELVSEKIDMVVLAAVVAAAVVAAVVAVEVVIEETETGIAIVDRDGATTIEDRRAETEVISSRTEEAEVVGDAKTTDEVEATSSPSKRKVVAALLPRNASPHLILPTSSLSLLASVA